MELRSSGLHGGASDGCPHGTSLGTRTQNHASPRNADAGNKGPKKSRPWEMIQPCLPALPGTPKLEGVRSVERQLSASRMQDRSWQICDCHELGTAAKKRRRLGRLHTAPAHPHPDQSSAAGRSTVPVSRAAVEGMWIFPLWRMQRARSTTRSSRAGISEERRTRPVMASDSLAARRSPRRVRSSLPAAQEG